MPYHSIYGLIVAGTFARLFVSRGLSLSIHRMWSSAVRHLGLEWSAPARPPSAWVCCCADGGTGVVSAADPCFFLTCSCCGRTRRPGSLLLPPAVIVSGQVVEENYPYFLGFAHLASGLSNGLSGLAAGICIGIVGDAGVRATGQNVRMLPGGTCLSLRVGCVSDLGRLCSRAAVLRFCLLLCCFVALSCTHGYGGCALILRICFSRWCNVLGPIALRFVSSFCCYSPLRSPSSMSS